FASLPEYEITTAEAEAAFAFHTIPAEVTWLDCATPSPKSEEGRALRFLVRLRQDVPRYYLREVSLRTMGRAYLSDSGEGYIADIYRPAVEALAQLRVANESSLIGYTMAHELGHLLIGPGHAARGIMSADWGPLEMSRIAKRWLEFDLRDRTAIRRRLEGQGGNFAAE
ncbi:MAG: hypothetical protein JO336_21440, partial [Acidobacteriia bacterium]|nr:hypothetical protein [Terriglobia bacterium]